MARQDPEALARHHRVQRLCRDLSRLLQASAEQRQAIDELLTRLEGLARRDAAPLIRTAGKSTDVSRG